MPRAYSAGLTQDSLVIEATTTSMAILWPMTPVAPVMALGVTWPAPVMKTRTICRSEPGCPE
jgi:hypothetical protein